MVLAHWMAKKSLWGNAGRICRKIPYETVGNLPTSMLEKTLHWEVSHKRHLAAIQAKKVPKEITCHYILQEKSVMLQEPTK